MTESAASALSVGVGPHKCTHPTLCNGRCFALCGTLGDQVVTRIADSNQGGSLSSSSGGGSIAPTAAWLAPALGEGWGQAAACRVALFWEGTQRYALLAKAKEVPQVLQGQVQQQGWQRQRQVQLCVPYYVHAAGIS